MTTAFFLAKLFVFSGTGRSLHVEYGRFALVNVAALIQVFVVSVMLAKGIFPAIGLAWNAELIAHVIGVLSPVLVSYQGHSASLSLDGAGATGSLRRPLDPGGERRGDMDGGDHGRISGQAFGRIVDLGLIRILATLLARVTGSEQRARRREAHRLVAAGLLDERWIRRAGPGAKNGTQRRVRPAPLPATPSRCRCLAARTCGAFPRPRRRRGCRHRSGNARPPWIRCRHGSARAPAVRSM